MSSPVLARAARIDPELVRRFDRSGPRYTSYPTAVEFHDGVGEAEYLELLARADEQEPGGALGLYVHVPFCERACSFCACHFVATPRHEVARPYLDRVRREVELLAERLPRRRTISQMQWGGGTPTYLSPPELEELFGAVASRFALAPGAEVAIEVDPRVTTREQLATLARLGFNRISMGVQDFSPAVQEAIGRGQSLAETRALLDAAREIGFAEGINFDLVYGLPRQDEESFAAGLERLVELRPDRVAVYSFAWVPWARPHQKRIEEASLPSAELRLELRLLARERLREAGYEPVGLDHFALPDDGLARAARDGRLDRNFMGYSANPPSGTVALGVTGIGELAGAYVQNARRLADYYEAIDAGRLPVRRGYLLDDDDRLRQLVIRRLLCGFEVDRDEIERRFGVQFDGVFAAPLARLRDVAASRAELVTDDGRTLRLTELGRLFVRNVCMEFDRHLETRRAAGRPAYSRTV